MRCSSPPAFACRLLESIAPVACQEAMLGDLIEEYTLLAESRAPLTASRWFWSQVCRSVPPLVWCSLRSRDWLMKMIIAMGVYVAMAVMKFAADLTISKLAAPAPMTEVVLAPALFLATCAIGGCVAARIRRGASIFLALLVMITVAVLIYLKLCTIPVPWWYPLGFFTLGPLAVLIVPVILGVPASRSGEPAR